MRRFRRNLAVTLLLTALSAQGICEVANITYRDFADQAGSIFLSELVSYLEAVSDFGNSRLEIEFSGRLPSMPPGRRIDFYLVDAEEGHFAVLYRNSSDASYKRAALVVRQTVAKTNATGEGPKAEELAYAESYRIEKGNRVNASISLGSIRLNIDGEAMQSGSAGDSIRVKVLETGKEFVGTVTGPLEVHIGL